jgi:hypothetical protein
VALRRRTHAGEQLRVARPGFAPRRYRKHQRSPSTNEPRPIITRSLRIRTGARSTLSISLSHAMRFSAPRGIHYGSMVVRQRGGTAKLYRRSGESRSGRKGGDRGGSPVTTAGFAALPPVSRAGWGDKKILPERDHQSATRSDHA